MIPQKIANLEQRLEIWQQERANWLCQQIPLVLVISVSVCSGLMYLGSFSEPGLKSSWLLWGAVFGVGLAITPIKLNYPKKPTQSDVEADIEIRKAFNMEASVSNERE